LALSLAGGAGSELLKVVPAIPDILEKGTLIGSELDRAQRSAIKAHHYFAGATDVGGKRLDVVLTVRETQDGKFHYSLNRDRDFDAGEPRKGAVGRPTSDDQPRTSAPEEPVTAIEGTHGELNIALCRESDKDLSGGGGSTPPPSVPSAGGGGGS
jgi:Large polyvalent protein-associated domain 3